MKNLKEIDIRLKIAKKRIDDNKRKNNLSNTSLVGNAFKISTELVVTVVVAAIMGFILDSWFDTKPWLIIAFFIIGIITGIINVIKSAKKMQEK
jgi:ATP synthase protein I